MDIKIKRVKSANDNYLALGLVSLSFGIIQTITMFFLIRKENNYIIYDLLLFCLFIGAILISFGIIFVKAYKRNNEFNIYILEPKNFKIFKNSKSFQDCICAERCNNTMCFVHEKDYGLCIDYKLLHSLKDIIKIANL